MKNIELLCVAKVTLDLSCCNIVELKRIFQNNSSLWERSFPRFKDFKPAVVLLSWKDADETTHTCVGERIENIPIKIATHVVFGVVLQEGGSVGSFSSDLAEEIVECVSVKKLKKG